MSTMSSKLSVVVESDYTCSICCEKYNNVKTKVLSCKHILCITCFKKHSDVSNNCPFCRRNIYKPIVTKKKAFSKTVLSLENVINSTRLLKSMNNTTPLDDNERLQLKNLFSELKQNMINLNLIVDDSFPVSSNTLINNNNFYLGVPIEEYDDDDDDEDDDENYEDNVNVNVIREENNRANVLFTEILSIFLSASATRIDQVDTNEQGSSD